MQKHLSMPLRGYLRMTAVLLPALPVLGLGISMCLFAGLGTDVNTSFQQGIGRMIGLEAGTVNLLFNTLVLVIYCFADRSLLGIGSLLVGFGLGPLMNLFEALLHRLIPGTPSMAIRVLFCVGGVTVSCVALAWYVQLRMGVQPLDMLKLTISKTLHCSYGVGVYIWSAIALGLTFVFHGDIGLGTVLNLLLAGLLCDLFLPLLQPAVRRLCGPYWKGDAVGTRSGLLKKLFRKKKVSETKRA